MILYVSAHVLHLSLSVEVQCNYNYKTVKPFFVDPGQLERVTLVVNVDDIDR